MALLSKLTGLAALAVLLAAAPARAQQAADGEVSLTQALADALAGDDRLTEVQTIEEIRARLGADQLDALDSYLASRTIGGDRRLALVTQDGDANAFDIVQEGPDNLLVLVQEGTGNTTVLTQQGQDNVVGLFVSGEDNVSEVTQVGDGNSYLVEFEGESLAHEVIQIGNDNQAVQLGTGVVPYSITQSGDNMEMVIRHNEAAY